MNSTVPTSSLPSTPHGPSNRWREGVLVLITMVWGGTFLVVQIALQWSGAFGFVGLRFGLAALLLAVVLRRRLSGLTRGELRAGVMIGAATFFGYGLQTLGLQSISSSKSAFLTALYVPMVPLLQWLVWKRRPQLAAIAGITLAFIGTLLLSDPSGFDLHFGPGEWLTIGCAVAIALEILLLSRLTTGCDAGRLALVQLVVVALLCLPTAVLRGEPMPQPTPGFIACLTGIACASAFIQFGLNWAQQAVPATRATLIYAMEPVWAGIVGWWAGDRLGVPGLAGGALIVISVMASEWKPRRKDGR